MYTLYALLKDAFNDGECMLYTDTYLFLFHFLVEDIKYSMGAISYKTPFTLA